MKKQCIIFVTVLCGFFLLLATPMICISAENKTHVGSHIIKQNPGEFEKELKVMEDIGMDIVRVSLFWQVAEPKKGSYQWDGYDEMVNLAKKHNIEILFTIKAISPWGSSNPSDLGKRGYHFSSPPKNMEDYENFITNLISHYKGKINYIQIENEPNAKAFWNGTIQEYITLLQAAYKAAKKANSDIKVLSAGLACGASRPKAITYGIDDYLDMARQVIKSHSFDIFDIHNYFPIDTEGTPYPITFANLIDRINKILKEENANVPIWLSEMGIPGKTFKFPKGIKPYQSDEERQSKDLTSLAKTSRDKGVKAIFWLKIFDSEEGLFSDMGLLYGNGKKKKAYNTLKAIITKQ